MRSTHTHTYTHYTVAGQRGGGALMITKIIRVFIQVQLYYFKVFYLNK